MSHEFFYEEEVGAVLIKMGPEGMTESVAGDTPFPAELLFMFMYLPADEPGVNRPVRPALLREEVASWPSAFEPVFGKDIQGLPGEDRVPVRAVL